MDDLKLAERCERATGPDRGLDGRIAYALGWRFSGITRGPDDPDFDEWYATAGHWAQPDGDFCPIDRSFSDDDYPDPPEWTASLDAAMTLVPEGVELTLDVSTPRTTAQLFGADPLASATAATPALAICAAALRSQQETGK